MVQRGLRWQAGLYRGEERSADSLVRVFFWRQFRFARTRLSALLFPPFLESATANAGVASLPHFQRANFLRTNFARQTFNPLKRTQGRVVKN